MLRTRSGGLKDFETRLLNGDVMAARALVRQAMPNTLELPIRDAQVRMVADEDGSDRLEFTGYACVTGREYEMQDWAGAYSEIVNVGAFVKTLSESPDVIFVYNHDWEAIPMARTIADSLTLTEVVVPDANGLTGLYVRALLDPVRPDVITLRSAVDGGEVVAMSFAFCVTRQTWSPDYMLRSILEVDMDGGDASPVTWPANPATAGTTAIRSRQAAAVIRSGVPKLLVQRARAEKRIGATLSAATQEVLQQVLDLIASADEAVDAAQPLLAELMGVANPDDPDEAPEATEDDETDDETGDGMTEAESAPPRLSLEVVRALRARHT